MEESINPTINIGPVTFNLTIVSFDFVTVALIFGFIYWATRNMTLRPTGKQNALEYLFDFVVGFTKSNLGPMIRIILSFISVYSYLWPLQIILA